MNEGSTGPIVDKSKFFILTTSGKPVQRAPQRDPAGVFVSTTGLAETNVGGADAVDDVVRWKGLDPEQVTVVVGGNEETNQVAVWLVKPNTPGATAVRRNVAKHTLTLYLHELFAAKPGLRPEKARWCVLQPETDSDGDPCILISLRVGLERRRSAKRKAAGSEGNQG